MKIAVLGANGMLGSDLMGACGKAGVEVHGFDLPEVDISKESSGLDRLPDCDWVVNCAAYTDVDGAEANREKAFAVNRYGTGRAAAWCSEHGVPLIYISTDYVFDGSGSRPYREDDPVKPLNAYGESKFAGEEAVQSRCKKCLIIRTQSLFGVNGRNFVKVIMSHLERNDEPLKVVNDQTSSPTYTAHLADAILRLLNTGKQGIVHVSASGSCTWYEFACAIREKVKHGTVIRPITSDKYARPAQRPAYSVLDNSRYTSWTGHKMPTWEEGLEEYLSEVRGQKSEVRNKL